MLHNPPELNRPPALSVFHPACCSMPCYCCNSECDVLLVCSFLGGVAPRRVVSGGVYLSQLPTRPIRDCDVGDRLRVISINQSVSIRSTPHVKLAARNVNTVKKESKLRLSILILLQERCWASYHLVVQLRFGIHYTIAKCGSPFVT